MTTPKVELRNISKTFYGDGKSIKALEDVSFHANTGEFVTVIGPSGSGKSTLFNLIVGLLEPDEGEICFDGQVCEERTGHVGYMPQRDLLLPWRNVLDNVILAHELRGTPRDEARIQAREMLPLFGLEDFSDAYPFELSGGMRQRAALLRTMLTEREVLLLDEPFGALDALTRRELQDWLLDVWRRFKQTVIFITHDVEEALFLADRVLVLSSRPGRVIKSLEVNLARPRRQGMIAATGFGEQVTELLEALGLEI
ncbi:MAG: ATP-binding cassette domain-containing protein [Anaerolineales bacterium]|nr:ATP-binding cassette domain-containing protein [Anaerolineales bacterium]